MTDHGRSARLGGLDGLRGMAALAVFCVHYNQVVRLEWQFGPFDLYRLMANGEHGVALFFILSGVLLARPYWRAMGDASVAWPDVRVYTLRRLARIFPAYYVALTILVLASGLWRFPAGWIDIGLHYCLLFGFAEFSIFSINAPFWTLAVEVQFYLLLPVLFLAVRRTKPAIALAAMLLLAASAWAVNDWLVSSVTRTVHWPGAPSLVWIRPYGAVVSHSLIAHLPHFLIGVVGGWLLVQFAEGRYRPTGGWMAETSFWVCLAITLLLLATPAGDAVQLPHGRYGLPLIPVLLGIIVVAAPLTRAACGALDSGPLRWLGQISYGLYIFHLPCISLIDRVMTTRGWDAAEHWLVFGCVSLGSSLLVAQLSWILVERPVLRRAHPEGRERSPLDASRQ